MNKDVEQALFDHVATKPDMSVDDMLWWLYDKYKLVVGTRTIRRAFERRNTSHKKFRQNVHKELTGSRDGSASLSAAADASGDHSHLSHTDNTYQSPYAPMANMGNNASGSDISPELARALGGLAQSSSDNIHPDLVGDSVELSEDEETMQLQLQQIALQKRELELKIKMRRMQKARRSSHTPRLSTDAHDQSFFTELEAATSVSGAHPSTTTGPSEASPATNPKPRDSRSKSKVEEAKKRTEERQERMLKDLEKRSRRREHLTAEWVQVNRQLSRSILDLR